MGTIILESVPLMIPASTGLWAKLAAGFLLVTVFSILLAVSLSLLSQDSQILLESDRADNWDIYRMDINRNLLVNLTHSPTDDHDPSWSARTQQIAFSSDRDGNAYTEIYVMGGSGDNLRRVTPPDGIYWKPAWLPDGRLAVVFNFGIIRILDLTTGQSRSLADGFAPVWAPDGRHVAFEADQPRTDSNADIYTLDADSHNLRNLTVNPANDSEPAWSPDGQSIAFVSMRDGNPAIYVMNALCAVNASCDSPVRRLTNNTAIDLSPAWSPDGQQIVFESDRDGSKQIYVINVDGSGLRKITDGQFNYGVPVWITNG